MGWRGYVRSLEADRKRKARLELRRDQLLAKARSITYNSVSSFEAEAQRELEKIIKYEESLSEKPISKNGLTFVYPNKWVFDEFSDDKGQITYKLQVVFLSDDFKWEPQTVFFEKRSFTLVSVSISTYGTFLAFEIRYEKNTSGTKNTKIVNKKNPENSLVAIKMDDQLFFPVEGTIDGQVVEGAKRYGILVVEPFTERLSEFEVLFIPKEENDNTSPEKIKVFCDNYDVIYQKVFSSKTLYEKFYDQIREKKENHVKRITQQLKTVQNNVAEQRYSEAGCLTLLFFAPLSYFYCVLFFPVDFARILFSGIERYL